VLRLVITARAVTSNFCKKMKRGTQTFQRGCKTERFGSREKKRDKSKSKRNGQQKVLKSFRGFTKYSIRTVKILYSNKIS
jgi:hypothetical protein